MARDYYMHGWEVGIDNYPLSEAELAREIRTRPPTSEVDDLANILMPAIGPSRARSLAYDLVQTEPKPVLRALARLVRKHRPKPNKPYKAPRGKLSTPAATRAAQILEEITARQDNPFGLSFSNQEERAVRELTKVLRKKASRFLRTFDTRKGDAEAAARCTVENIGPEDAQELARELAASKGWWFNVVFTPDMNAVVDRMRRGDLAMHPCESNIYVGTERQAAQEAVEEEFWGGDTKDFEIAGTKTVIYRGIPVLIVELDGPWPSLASRFADDFNLLRASGMDVNTAGLVAASGLARETDRQGQVELADLLETHGAFHAASAIRQSLNEGRNVPDDLEEQLYISRRPRSVNPKAKCPPQTRRRRA